MPMHYACDEDKEHLKELEFYKNLAKAASLASQNNNDNNSNNNNLINNNEKSPLPHHPALAQNNNSISNTHHSLTSPASSPQPMQIDSDLHHSLHEDDDNHVALKRHNDEIHNLTDNDAEMLEPPTEQAKASALAAAAAAAQAHLNGTSEYISKSNFIYKIQYNTQPLYIHTCLCIPLAEYSFKI